MVGRRWAARREPGLAAVLPVDAGVHGAGPGADGDCAGGLNAGSTGARGGDRGDVRAAGAGGAVGAGSDVGTAALVCARAGAGRPTAVPPADRAVRAGAGAGASADAVRGRFRFPLLSGSARWTA